MAGAAALALACTACDPNGQGGSSSTASEGGTLLRAPAQELPAAYEGAASSLTPPPSAPVESVAQESRASFDGDTRTLGGVGADPVAVPASSTQESFPGYTADAKADTLTINEPPSPTTGKLPKKLSLTQSGWVWPVPNHPGRNETAEISSGREMRSGDDGKMGTADDYRHRGVDIMYRIDKSKRACREKEELPWASRCYEMPPETPALAARGGVVKFSGEISTGGRVLIDHGGGIKTGYIHLSKRLVKVGDTVTAGQPVGIIGFNPDGYRLAHLHFDVIVDGKFVDPEKAMKKWGRSESQQQLAQAD